MAKRRVSIRLTATSRRQCAPNWKASAKQAPTASGGSAARSEGEPGLWGILPDDQSFLILAAARLRHVARTKWSSSRYLDMTLLERFSLEEHGTETDELTA